MKLTDILLEEQIIFENAFASMGDELGDVLDKNLSDEDKEKLKQLDSQQNEIAITSLIATGLSVIGSALTLNAIVSIVGKYGAKLIEKMAGKETDASRILKKAYEYAHHNEEMIIQFLGKATAGKFTSNKKIITIVGAVLFIVFLAGLAAPAGVGAVQAAQKAKYGKMAMKATKFVLKGKDITAAGKMAQKAMITGVSPEVAAIIRKMAGV